MLKSISAMLIGGVFMYILTFAALGTTPYVNRYQTRTGVKAGEIHKEIVYHAYYPLFVLESLVTKRLFLMVDKSGDDQPIIDKHGMQGKWIGPVNEIQGVKQNTSTPDRAD